MLFSFRFQDPPLDLEVDEAQVFASWSGPEALSQADATKALADRLEAPLGLPAVRSAVVPGDRVAIPIDDGLDNATPILGQVLATLEAAGVERGSIAIVPSGTAAGRDPVEWPTGVAIEPFDPADRAALAYLASTAEGRRVYLGRSLTDADFVLPVGLIRFEPGAGLRGPWSLLYPGMSDLETRQALLSDRQNISPEELPTLDTEQEREAVEVAWLLGCLYQIGIVPAAEGIADVLVGSAEEVAREGRGLADRLWTFSTEGEADVVVAAVGRPGVSSTLEDLARGFRTASALGRPGTALVLLSNASGEPGPALRRLVGLDDSSEALAALEGAEEEADYEVALALAAALATGKVYLYSRLDEELVEELGMIPLSRPDEAARLVARGRRCILIDQADRTRVAITGAELSAEDRP